MQRKIFLLVFLVVFLGFFLRFFKVVDVPPSLNWDEVSIGYNAYSILKSGRDEWGTLLPLDFKSYGEYKLPVQIYGSIPGVAIFGLNDLGVRITPIIYGSLTVLLVFFLGRAIFNSSVVGLISAFLLAVSPWHIQLTRASFESSFSVFWVVLGIWFLIKGFKDSKWFIFSIIPFGISIYTYNSARIFIPLFLLVIFLIYRDNFFKFKKQIILSIFIFGLFLVPLVPFLLNGETSARYKLVSITDDPGLIPRIDENRGNSHLMQPLPLLVHNKFTYIGFYFVRNYLSHFTPGFLFISGAPHKQHHVQNIGELYLIQAPFLFLGLYYLFKKKNKTEGLFFVYRFRWIVISWLLLSFVPVSTTNDSIPHALRTLIAAPAYQLLTAFGLFVIFDFLKKVQMRKITITLFVLTVILFSVQFYDYLNNYYNIYPYLYSRDWQYGYKQVVNFISGNYSKYDLIVFSRVYGEPHMFTLFYTKYDPLSFQNNPNLDRFETYNWVRVLRFDKYYFPDLGDSGTMYKDIVSQNKGKRILFIGKHGDFPENLVKLKTVNFLNGQVAFEVVEKT